MIKNIFTNGSGLSVQGGNSQYPYIDMNRPSSGMVRYNGNNQNFEVYDGSMWMTISGNSVAIQLDEDTKSLLEWARAKRANEKYLEEQRRKNPTIADLLDKRDVIDQKIEMVETLLQEQKRIVRA